MSASKIAREYFAAYDSRNLDATQLLLAEDFTFSSPHDEHIDRVTYFLRIWPRGPQHLERKIWKVFEDGNEVFVTFECSRADGTVYRNTEFFHVENGRIRHVEVFHGRDTQTKIAEPSTAELPLLHPDSPVA